MQGLMIGISCILCRFIVGEFCFVIFQFWRPILGFLWILGDKKWNTIPNSQAKISFGENVPTKPIRQKLEQYVFPKMACSILPKSALKHTWSLSWPQEVMTFNCLRHRPKWTQKRRTLAGKVRLREFRRRGVRFYFCPCHWGRRC